MDLFGTLSGIAHVLIFYGIPFLFVLTIVVFFHELGHFSVARFFGTRIDTFSIGFGKEIFGWNDKHGTRWRVAWIPLGGYVKFFGDENAASVPDKDQLEQQSSKLTAEERAACFHFKPLHQRAAIVAAGPFANFLLAIVIFALVFVFVGERQLAPVADQVDPDGAAAAAGILPGDVITQINSRKISSFSDLQAIVSLSADTPLKFIINRQGEVLELMVTPRREIREDRFGTKHKVGLVGIQRSADPESVQIRRYDPITAIGKGVQETWMVIDRTFVFLGRLIVGKEDATQIGGPIKIAQVSGQVATLGIIPLITLTAVLSVSIGLINLFPVPILDGGHLLFYGIEAVNGQPLNERAQEFGFRVGLALILGLMTFVMWNDITGMTIL